MQYVNEQVRSKTEGCILGFPKNERGPYISQEILPKNLIQFPKD